MKRSYWLALGFAIAATGWIASGQLRSEKPVEAAPPAAAVEAPQRPTVRVRHLHARPYQAELVVRGRTEASRSLEIRAETAGRVEAIEAERGARVREGQVIARLALEDKPARLTEAKALLAQRELEFEGARTLAQKGFRADVQLAQVRAQLDAARAALSRMEYDIRHATIAAPFAAVLDRRSIELGDYVKEGDPVAMLVDLDPLYIVGQVTEREVGRLRVGQSVDARLITGQQVTGTTRYIAAAADPVTRTFRVEIEVPNPGGTMPSGVTAELRTKVADVMAHLISPAFLALTDTGEVGVKIVGANDVVAFQPAIILGDGPDGIWLGGLPESVRVITIGHEFVKAGQPVTPVVETGAGS